MCVFWLKYIIVNELLLFQVSVIWDGIIEELIVWVERLGWEKSIHCKIDRLFQKRFKQLKTFSPHRFLKHRR